MGWCKVPPARRRRRRRSCLGWQPLTWLVGLLGRLRHGAYKWSRAIKPWAAARGAWVEASCRAALKGDAFAFEVSECLP